MGSPPILARLALALIVASCSGDPSPAPSATPTPASPTGSPAATPSATSSPSDGASPIALREIVAGLESPVHAMDAGDASGRLYVVEQAGRIMVVENGAVRSEPFLDITTLVSRGNEQGLLSVAFGRAIGQDDRFWVDYTDLNGDTAIVRYRVEDGGARADPASARTILAIDQPAANHNGGLVLFGPDDRLYVGMGDGGGGRSENGQRTDTLLGKMLRLDVSVDPYAIPPDNPFVDDPAVLDEIWAVGLRNPWRFAFDLQTGDLWIGDVGAVAWEEVDRQPAGSRGGENYGWPRMEGPDCASAPCDPSAYVLPVAAIHHGQGDCALIGGYVYRGTAVPELQGTYLFGDSCSGRLWGLDAALAAQGSAEPVLLLRTDLVITSFAEDRAGEVYVVDRLGALYQVVRAP